MTEPIYRIGAELTPRALLLFLAEAHGIHNDVRDLLDGVPEIEAPRMGLGALLHEKRKRASLTIEEVHDRSRISRSQLTSYERGQQKNPGLRTLQALSYGYRIPFAYVVMAALWDIRPRAKIKTRRRPNGEG